MKKLTFLALGATLMAMMFSCSNTPKADLKTEIDTLSYAIGMANSQGLKQYLANMEIDTTDMSEFYRGLNAGVNAGDDKKKAAYFVGFQIGQQITNQMIVGMNNQIFGEDSTQTLSLKNIMAGFISGGNNNFEIMNFIDAQALTQMKMESLRAKSMEKQFASNKTAGEEFLKKYAKEAGVKKLDGGILYKVIKEGNGPIPKDSATVIVNYEGRTIDGEVFDSSYERNQPAKMRTYQVIKGWTEALKHMPVGSIWEIAIPQELAYGSNGNGKTIKPFSALVFKIELTGTE